jgi:hypothetical protein
MYKLYYYKLEEAEELKRLYSSWIGKKAHIGSGKTAMLKSILIKEKRNFSPLRKEEDLYRVVFEFDTGHRLSGHEFLFFNGFIFSFASGNRNQDITPNTGKSFYI